MKSLLVAAVAVGALVVLPGPADARKQQRGYQSQYSGPSYRAYRPRPRAYYVPGPSYYAPPSYDSSTQQDCIDARNLDPGGNYDQYPCWAAKAFAPKRDR